MPYAFSSAATARLNRSFGQSTGGGMPGKLPATVKNASTTRKVRGGALLAPGLTLLARRGHRRPASPEAAPLDELLHFVNDRIEGYQRAVDQGHDAQLRGYYQQLVSQSQQFATDLNPYLTREGGERETSPTRKGQLYRARMAAKAAVTGHDEKTILGSNLYGEEWALKAYQAGSPGRPDTHRGPCAKPWSAGTGARSKRISA